MEVTSMENDVVAQLTKAIQGQSKVQEALISALTGEEYGEKVEDTNTAVLLFGGGGIFSTPGLDPNVITAHIRPKGIAALLPKFASLLEQPLYASITGFTGADGGSEPVNPCDDALSGFMKGCNLTAQFGRVARATNTIEWDKVMTKLNAGVTTDLMLRGRLLGMDDFNPAGLSEDAAINIVTMGEMVGVGVQFERVLSRHTWQGSPANNTSGGGYKEFPGLDNQIATGQVDANTGVACEALDSDVKDFNFNPVGGTSPSIVEQLSMLEFFLRYNADRMGLDPATWAIAMRPELWYELSAIWPCQYNTNRCATSVIGSSEVFIDGRENVAERDRMRRGMTIDINGNTYPVVVDTGIFEDSNETNGNLIPGQFASSIYMLPLTITGGFPVTYFEYLDYRAGARDAALLRGRNDFWTDDGVFSWTLEEQKWCYDLTAKTEQRVVLRTPQLAGRIDNVMYEPVQHLRSPYPDSPYFADGGVSLRSTPSLNAVWN